MGADEKEVRDHPDVFGMPVFAPGVRLIYMLTHFVRVNVGLDNVCKVNFRVCRQDLGFTEFSLARIQEYRK